MLHADIGPRLSIIYRINRAGGAGGGKVLSSIETTFFVIWFGFSGVTNGDYKATYCFGHVT